MDYVIAMEPETVLIYIGGNDADGQSWYGPQEAASHYAEILDRFLENRITPIVHLVHEASTSRNREYVQTFNRLVAEAARERSLSVVPDLKALSFDESREVVETLNSPLTYDGEHLKPGGYVLWAEHIKQALH